MVSVIFIGTLKEQTRIKFVSNAPSGQNRIGQFSYNIFEDTNRNKKLAINIFDRQVMVTLGILHMKDLCIVRQFDGKKLDFVVEGSVRQRQSLEGTRRDYFQLLTSRKGSTLNPGLTVHPGTMKSCPKKLGQSFALANASNTHTWSSESPYIHRRYRSRIHWRA